MLCFDRSSVAVSAFKLVVIQQLAEVTPNPFLREAVFLQRVFVLALEFLLALRGFVEPRAGQMVVGQAFLPAGAGDFPVASS